MITSTTIATTSLIFLDESLVSLASKLELNFQDLSVCCLATPLVEAEKPIVTHLFKTFLKSTKCSIPNVETCILWSVNSRVYRIDIDTHMTLNIHRIPSKVLAKVATTRVGWDLKSNWSKEKLNSIIGNIWTRCINTEGERQVKSESFPELESHIWTSFAYVTQPTRKGSLLLINSTIPEEDIASPW
ncbi:hypothetical protein SLEP1_g41836 [Rubroshorea leprosula]|uniref:Uncharacterized protein n=1 Tax=Rubroshorea leprosula TaxID=152421 RepID=A0AAV5L7V5_9ROSI|nr:hypothetical protein SLEP1_g41836 [Rubroshorea leprosula]